MDTMPAPPSRTLYGLVLDPDDETAVVRGVAVESSGGVSDVVGGRAQAVEIDGGSVLWLDEEGKTKGYPTNLLATKIAHRLHAGLYPDDTINGRALILGERTGRDGELTSTDLTWDTVEALRAVGVAVIAQASQEVLLTAGGAWNASLNHERAGGNCMVTTQQIDETVYVVGQDDFVIGAYSTASWLGEVDEEAGLIETENARQAWQMLQHLREDCLLWQCGGCDAWIHTSNRPRVGVLRCATCGDGGVDFHHADRHVGEDSD
ncbi:DUF3846 domain-containing protein [Nocardioides eburneiflavus]|uniref:DUF3846 domain-containing protein n=1 Tax=Nocardioides eburneiflavus TaxID=2518372 RepID=A0A4Z1CE95_9ACTN|nr:DUF3846 domain-containing protein [Nocardioides eburneiflavus]TGN64235.1 DUF3846 domain-containing protein [Nocardioides eburneiflavus]